ncbi:TetR family transcriptional regulator [Rhodococcus sp. 14-2470-1b]|uniref:TetR/AcrR family transcriptional regulator n=1 Tax=Rhodococcus sp. 14-2470-1b TaxID=2023149 RepID=UPI000B9ABEA0|nr:TetR/AcrR family transcriptional regulator [Rhodococcus sp. 14-2470-1b]OZF57610.1 TetR family transcriptional regulator [Rhodococcus sp. 14-2470-1b]
MPRAGAAADRASINTPRRRHVDTSRREELLASIEDIFLAEGFTSVTVDDLTKRLRCSKATLYSVASTKEQLVIAATKHFFATEAEGIEAAVAEEPDPRLRITTYLAGVAKAMRRNSRAFYADMVAYRPTAEIYARNTDRAAARVQEMIAEGVESRRFRATDATFAAQLVALAIDAVQSGVLLERTGLSAADAFSELADLLLHGLLRNDSPHDQGRAR